MTGKAEERDAEEPCLSDMMWDGRQRIFTHFGEVHVGQRLHFAWSLATDNDGYEHLCIYLFIHSFIYLFTFFILLHHHHYYIYLLLFFLIVVVVIKSYLWLCVPSH